MTLRRLVVVLTLGVIFVAIPEEANAHGVLVSSEPEPGQRLGTAPGVVVLRFSEPLNAKLSRARVVDPTGRSFQGGASGQSEIRIGLSSNAPGVYQVEWKTVSVVDGHTLHGSLEFGVGVAPTGASEGSVRSTPGRSDLLISLARAVEYGALLLALGMLLLRSLARGREELRWIRPRLALPLALAFVAGIGVVLGEALAAAPSPSLSAVWSYLSTGLPGLARLSRLGLEGLALTAAVVGAPSLWAWVVTVVIALAAAGHAAAIRPQWWGIAVDVIHLLSGGLWAGGILALAFLRSPQGWTGAGGRALLSRFSPVALGAFAVTVGFGAIQAFQELGGFGALVHTSYGWALLLKAGLVGLMVPLSFLAWRARRPRLRMEAALAVLVIGAASLLAAYPLPPSRLVAAEAARERAARPTTRPGPGDLTLGGHAGQVLVGLTLRPGEPGPNEAIVYLLPLEGERAAAALQAQLSVDGRALPLTFCGRTCRRGSVELRGGETVAVRVAGSTGGLTTFPLPELPAPDGSRLLRIAQARMHRLRSYHLQEVLSSGLATIHASYEFQAPNRMHVQVDDSSASIWIGSTRYIRDLPKGSWKEQTGGPSIPVPSFIWDYFKPLIAVRILGAERIGGAPTTIVAFVDGQPGDPIWFRLWVDSSGLVRQAQMRAPGHFMDHRYSAFDASIVIQAPVAG